MTEPIEWFGLKEAARRLAVSEANVYKLIEKRVLHPRRIGEKGAYRFNDMILAACLKPARNGKKEA